MARVKYLRREDAPASNQAIYDRLERERRFPTPNVFLMMAHAPEQLDGLLTYAGALRRATELGPKLRELVILSVAYAMQGDYHAAHHKQDAINAGYTEEQIARLQSNEDWGDLFNRVETGVIRLGRAIGTREDVSDEIWADVASGLDEQQLVQLVLTASWYASGIITSNVLRLEMEGSESEAPPA